MQTLHLNRLFSTAQWYGAGKAFTPFRPAPAPARMQDPAPAPSSVRAAATNDSIWIGPGLPSGSTVGMAAVAHELRNSMAPLANALEIMGSGRADAAVVARTLPMARQQLRHMSRLVNDLLDAARFVNGDMDLEHSLANVQDIVADAVSACAESATQHRHKLTLELPREPLRVRVDLDRIAQVLANLLGNAIKYTPSGGRIAVTVWKEDGWACFSVADNGIGIDAGEIENVFGMFCQQQRSRLLSEGGLGIGLSVVRRLVELQGGQVTAHSAGKDQGSTFTVRLPLA